MVLIFKISECSIKIKKTASFEAMKSQNESYTSSRRLPGYSVPLNPNSTSESTEVATDNRSKELSMECSGNETVIESSNTRSRNCSNELTTQLFRGKETVDVTALTEGKQETVQDRVGKYYA